MNEALMYCLKVNIAIALFYLFYRLVFYNDTFWSTRRFYLVFSMLLAAVYPFISVSGWLEKQEPMQAIMTNYVQLEAVTVNATPASVITLENLLLAAYGIVSCFLFIKMVVQLVSILRWRLKGKKVLLKGVEIIAIDGTITPFSFFTTIFMNPALHNAQETIQILTHESTHARQWHSLDVILSEFVTILFWINPAVWLFKREIRHNLEFLADNSVLQSGIDSKEYQYHLLQLSYQVPENLLINKFNISPLKKRITMMNQQKTKKAGILKYSLVVPLALALVLSSNAQSLVASAKKALTAPKNTEVVINSTENNPALAASESQASKPSIQKTGNKDVYEKVEKMPIYPGGVNELMNYLAKNIKYPADAQAKGIEGRIVVRFIVNKEGNIENSEIIRGLSPSCDKEALRVVNAMPKWIPGKQDGKNVSVYYALPIFFKLGNGTTSSIKPVKNAIPGTNIVSKKSNSAIDPNNPPVYIIDGVQQPKGIVNIKPETIASMNVLKPDTEKRKAELIAQYGEQAANGVIIITTKK